MYCRNCGKQLADGTAFCPECGASQTAQSHSAYTPAGVYPQAKPSVSFVDAIKLFFKNYTNFSGRSRRSEYWFAFLFTMIVGSVVAAILPDLSWIWSLAVLVPNWALNFRRLHDIGKSGWWCLISLIPLVGGILCLIWYCKDSDPNPNQWGASPKF